MRETVQPQVQSFIVKVVISNIRRGKKFDFFEHGMVGAGLCTSETEPEVYALTF